MKVVHEPVKFKVNKKRLIKAAKSFGKAFIAYTAQYSHIFKGMENAGLVLGCSVNCIKKFKGDLILFVGDGVFHALMIKKEFINKKVLVLNPKDYSVKEIKDQEVNKFIKREAILIDKLKNSKKVGIIICAKPGQERMKLSESIKKVLESKGKKVYLFLAETINPDEFMNYSKMDILINTACPRLALDDYGKFSIPIINCRLVLSEYFKD